MIVLKLNFKIWSSNPLKIHGDCVSVSNLTQTTWAERSQLSWQKFVFSKFAKNLWIPNFEVKKIASFQPTFSSFSSAMTFDINRSFKWLPFTWGDYNGLNFQGVEWGMGVQRNRLTYLWTRFWWLFTVYDLVRYMVLAVLPPSDRHNGMEFFLGELLS